MDTHPQEKACTKCGLSQPLDAFDNEPKSPDGKAWYCKACVHAYNAARITRPKIVLEEKACPQCEVTKPLAEFGKDKYTRDGRATRCLQCKSGATTTWRGKNREKSRAISARWKAENPEKLAAYTEAHKEERSIQRRARYAADPVKENAQNAANYAANKDKWRPTRQAWEAAHQEERRTSHLEHYLLRDPEERRAQGRAWGAAHPEKVQAKNQRRRARKKNAPVNDLSAEQWEEIQGAYQFRCVYCKPNCKACQRKTHKLTPDHVTPYAQNGSNTLWNVVPACLSCNARKHAGKPPNPVQPLLLTTAPPRKPKQKKAF